MCLKGFKVLLHLGGLVMGGARLPEVELGLAFGREGVSPWLGFGFRLWVLLERWVACDDRIRVNGEARSREVCGHGGVPT